MRVFSRLEILNGACCDAPSPAMTRDDAADYAQLFRALGDETRVRIVGLLAEHEGPLCVCYVEAAFDLSQPTISHHLKVLREAGLVTTERRGVWIYYHLNRERLGMAGAFFALAARARTVEFEQDGDAMTDSTDTREQVRKHYASAALRVLQPGQAAESSCCGGSLCCAGSADPITGNLYQADDLAILPGDAVAASLGCGNPTALAELRPGEVVLDLGSGGGIDVLLSAKRVGATGKAYGLDMTDEMLDLARRNAAAAGQSNVEFLKGEIEQIPLPDASVDVVLSNCVINLSTDKGRVLREAFRVLKPGGRFAVSDVVVDGPTPKNLRHQIELWVGCIAGALERQEYERLLGKAGFAEVSIQPTRFYAAGDLNDPSLDAWLATLSADERSRLDRAFMSAFVRATKPDHFREHAAQSPEIGK